MKQKEEEEKNRKWHKRELVKKTKEKSETKNISQKYKTN